ncbi:MAG: phosphoribosylglycinamide formyltransferase [Ignavibacteria bacterium]|nr:phosphoribosylglycinamide formyltransferase [Ignavibacteria bacterium]
MNDFKIAVFASGRGSNLQSIIDAIKSDKLKCKISFVLSNNSDSGALEIAKSFNIPAVHLSEKKFFADTYLNSLISVLKKYEPDLIVLAGFMKKIPTEIIQLYKNKIVNIHPALLPKYGGQGMYGMNVHKAVFEAKEKYSGVTIHLVNENYDEGKILYQEKVDISECNSPEEIAQKVLKIEHKLYPEVLQMIIDKRIELE